jgi:C1A family cysteine protease
MGKHKGLDVNPFILNCVPSVGTETDWTLEDAVQAKAISLKAKVPETVDLRENWWKIRNQSSTGACVGFATADGVLRFLYVKAGLIQKADLPSPRFIWMANKETDNITSYPTTFIESAGTQTKLALRVARNFGCVLEQDLPMQGGLSQLGTSVFYTKAAKFRISSYHNLKKNLDSWKRWLAFQGPILTRLNVDRTWDLASQTNGHLETYKPDTVRGGHAVCLVGYTNEYFIVRNSWGDDWGDDGFAYAHNDYAKEAFDESYGAIL